MSLLRMSLTSKMMRRKMKMSLSMESEAPSVRLNLLERSPSEELLVPSEVVESPHSPVAPSEHQSTMMRMMSSSRMVRLRLRMTSRKREETRMKRRLWRRSRLTRLCL